MKNCNDVYRYICENLDQGLNSPECLEIRKHLQGCADCTAYLNTLKQTVSLYRALPTPDLPRAIQRRLSRVLPSLMRKTRRGEIRKTTTRRRPRR